MKRIAALAWVFATCALTVALLGWMAARVAEHPGVPRELGPLPPWFSGAPAPPAPTHEALPPAQAPAQAAAPAADFVDVAGGKVEIVLNEYEMKPRHIRVASGPVTFVLRNEGRFAHNFHVEGPGIDTTAEKFSPGRSIRLEVALQAGEYKISCPLSNHDQRGMHGVLIATAAK